MAIEFMQLKPALLTPQEACEYLRIADDSNADALKKKMDRLVDSKQIRPTLVCNRRLYSVSELDAFIERQTERYGQAGGGS